MADEGNESLAWDRVGRFLQQSGTKASEISERNLKLWSSISSHLKKEDKYTADEMADDFAKSMATAMSNASDIFSLLTTGPRQNRLAQPLPTAFLLFDRTGPLRHRLLEPVRILVDFDLGGRKLPPTAKIALNGTATAKTAADVRPADSSMGVERLLAGIVARHDEQGGAYILETVNYHVGGAAADVASGASQGLVPGVYDGIVYLVDPPLALANIRILVEGDPPDPQPDVGNTANETTANENPNETPATKSVPGTPT